MLKIELGYQAEKRFVEQEGRSLENKEDDDVYGSNIQTAELNMLGAALAITEWKAIRGVYRNERDRDVDRVIYSATTGKILVG